MVKLCLSEHRPCAPHCMEGVPVSWEGLPGHKVCTLVSSFPKTVLENGVRTNGWPRLLPTQNKRNDCLFPKQPQRQVTPRNPERCGASHDGEGRGSLSGPDEKGDRPGTGQVQKEWLSWPYSRKVLETSKGGAS